MHQQVPRHQRAGRLRSVLLLCAAYPAHGRALGEIIEKPACNFRTPVPPVGGALHERELPPSGSSGPRKAWEFALESGCSLELFERTHIAGCLGGVWVVAIGASQTNIWTIQLANTLVPNTLLTKRDNFSIDGVFTQMIDVVFRDGKVIYKNVMRDPWYADGKRIGAHSRKRDADVLKEAFAQVARAPEFDSRDIRITNFFAEYWDHVDLALDTVNSDSHWSDAEVTVAVSVGLWYANSLHCGSHMGWCATRPEYGKLSLEGLIAQYTKEMKTTLSHLEEFCADDGRAGQRGCAVTSIDHCGGMQAVIWHRLYDAVKDSMEGRSSVNVRFVDLWMLTLQIPEDCLGGHQSPASTIWTWQVLMGGICAGKPAAKGTLAAFTGPTCRAAEVHQHCGDPHAKGFHYLWECGLEELCSLEAVEPPASMHPIVIPDTPMRVDLAAASRVSVSNTWTTWYRAEAEPYEWAIAGVAVLVAAAIYIVTTACRDGSKAPAGKQYKPLDSNGDSQHMPEQVANGHGNGDDPQKPNGNGHDHTERVAPTSKGPPNTDKFSFGLARCLASMHVVAGHLYARQGIVDWYVFGWGFTWVPWFFMLSGFILFSAEARNPRAETPCEYVSRRSVTIYPLYAVGLVLAFGLTKSECKSPGWGVLVLQAFLGQAWVPWITEHTLQMQCWFLSCLVLYWACFRPCYRLVAGLGTVGVVLCMAVLYALPWLVVAVPILMPDGDLHWYSDHTFGHTSSWLDLAVVFLKFHPLCYMHVFVLGTLLGRLRLLLAENARLPLLLAMDFLAPLGYAALLVLFTVPALRPPAAKLSSRLSILLPLQSAIVLGLSGIPGKRLPVVAAALAPLNFLESYSYAIYVLQFICWHFWPSRRAGPAFFIFLAAMAVIAVHVVQKPADKLWRQYPRLVHAAPLVLACLLLLLSLLPDPECTADIPAMVRLDDRLVDTRLPLRAGSADGSVLINPSLLFWGNKVVVAARRHRRESDRSHDTWNGSTVVVLEQTWHSEIVLGSMVLDWYEWETWMASGVPPRLPAMAPWKLHTQAGEPWVKLCVREKFLPENNTLVRLVVTGPEDPKVFTFPLERGRKPGLGLAFSSYPPLGRHGCGKDEAVSQMYLGKGSNLTDIVDDAVGIPLACGSTKNPEKNWIPFQHRGRLYFVYSVLPHVVIEVQPDGTCGRRFSSNYAPLVRLQADRPGLAIRGSAQALLVNDPIATPSMPQAHYLGLFHVVDPKAHQYAHFAYRFMAHPPFDILQVSSQLPVRPAAGEDGGMAFAFVSGLAVRDRQVVISYAAGDNDPRALMLTLWRLDQMFTGNSDG